MAGVKTHPAEVALWGRRACLWAIAAASIGLATPTAAFPAGIADEIATAEAEVDRLEPASDRRELASALDRLGRWWLASGDPRAARRPLDRALVLADSLGDPSLRSLILSHLSWASEFDDDPRGAEARGREAIAAARAAGDSSLVGDAAFQLGRLWDARGKPAGAEPWHALALELTAVRAPETRAAVRIAWAANRQQLGQLADAEPALRQALSEAGMIGARNLERAALLGLGRLEQRRENYAEALSYYLSALEQLDSLPDPPSAEPIAPRPTRFEPYEAILGLFAVLDREFPDSGYAARAFEWAERARTRALLDQMSVLGIGFTSGDPQAVLDLDGAQALLPSKRVAMLYYAIGDSISWLWVIQHDRSDHFFLPPRHELASRIRAMRVGLSDPSRAGDRSVLGASHQLYRKLIEPALPLLKGVSDLIVVPHGDLARVPFEALLSLPPGDAGPVSGSYLIDRWAVSYLPSATTLARIPAPGTEEAVVTVVFRGTPGPRIAPLPDAASEIEALSSLTHQRSYLALTGADATRARLLELPKQIGADLLHLAAPGVMDDLEPDRSGWWLAPDSSEGAASFLHLRDLTGLNLAAGQITVSACETGRDRFDRGDGALGLARGLLSAGARGVMVSQWRVSDRSTAILMERFYTKILKEGVSRSQALADAKRELLHRAETRSPYFWAAFVLVGDPGPLERAIVR